MEHSKAKRQEFARQMQDELALGEDQAEKLTELFLSFTAEAEKEEELKTLYEKSFYQRKKEPYAVDKEIYRLALDHIRNYSYYKAKLREAEQNSASDMQPDSEQHLNIIVLKGYIEAIEDAFAIVPEDYREAVRECVVREKSVRSIAMKYAMSEANLYRYWNAYVADVAERLHTDEGIAKAILQAMEIALGWVPGYARKAILDFATTGKGFSRIEQDYGIELGLLRSYWQRYVCAFCKELGLIF